MPNCSNNQSHLYENLIHHNQGGGGWEHPIYSRRRRGGGFHSFINNIKLLGKNPINTGRRYVATMIKKHGTGIAQNAISGVLNKKSIPNIIKDTIKQKKGDIWKDTKDFFTKEYKQQQPKKKSKKRGRVVKRKIITKKTGGKRKQKGGQLKNKKMGITSASNHTKASRLMPPIFK